MTDKELIRALKHCDIAIDDYYCNNCPSVVACKTVYDNQPIAHAADRLEALLAENERLKAGKDMNVPAKWVSVRSRK